MYVTIRKDDKNDRSSFRPLAGIKVMYSQKQKCSTSTQKRFRPLAGIKVMYAPGFKRIVTVSDDVSVPLRGLR